MNKHSCIVWIFFYAYSKRFFPALSCGGTGACPRNTAGKVEIPAIALQSIPGHHTQTYQHT